MDPMTIFALTSGLAGLAGTAAGVRGQQQANAANADAAQAQMDFQAKQTSTQYQRATADLRAAGLNPILAAGGMSAGSGSGASYTAQNPNSEVASGLGSAAQSAMLGAQFDKLRSDTLLADSAASKNYSDAGLNPTKALQIVADTKLSDAQTLGTAASTRKSHLEGDILEPKAFLGRVAGGIARKAAASIPDRKPRPSPTPSRSPTPASPYRPVPSDTPTVVRSRY